LRSGATSTTMKSGRPALGQRAERRQGCWTGYRALT
jgi:hypothetical protein